MRRAKILRYALRKKNRLTSPEKCKNAEFQKFKARKKISASAISCVAFVKGVFDMVQSVVPDIDNVKSDLPPRAVVFQTEQLCSRHVSAHFIRRNSLRTRAVLRPVARFDLAEHQNLMPLRFFARAEPA